MTTLKFCVHFKSLLLPILFVFRVSLSKMGSATNYLKMEISQKKVPIIQATCARYGHWHKDKGKGQQLIKNVPRVIIFVIGGISFSEMRCAYEVTSNFKNWEVIIGSSHILTPEDFINNLSALSQ